jgi:hypothetical protein
MSFGISAIVNAIINVHYFDKFVIFISYLHEN